MSFLLLLRNQHHRHGRFLLCGFIIATGACVYACGSDDEVVAPPPTTPPDAGPPEAASVVDASNDAPRPGLPLDAPVTEQYVGGTRLKPKYMQPTDGLRGLIGWHDTLLAVDCTFQKAMDGELRCMPAPKRSQLYDRGFAADGCSGATMLVDKREGFDRDTCLPQKYFASSDESQCPTRTRVEIVGAASAATQYWYLEDTCKLSNLGNGWKLYSLTSEVAPTEWVKGTLANEPAKDGLSAAFVTGEDGSKGFFGWVDATHGNVPCGFARSADGEGRCLPFDPFGIVWEDLYSDTSCSSFLAQGLYSKCAGMHGRRYDDRGSCTPKFSVHPIVGPFAGATMYRGTPNPGGPDAGAGTCVGQPTGSSNEFYTTGPELPATTFSSVKSLDRVGAPMRMQRSRSVTSGGWIVGGGFHDSKRDDGCSFTTASDGKLRCMPIGPGPVGYYYADAACTEPLYRVYEQCGSIVPKYGRDLDNTTCPARSRVYAMGAKHTGTVYEKYGTGPCTVDTNADSLILHVRAAEIPAADLDEGTEIIPP